MKKGYWIAMVDITDPENFKAYIGAYDVAFAKYGGRFLASSGSAAFPEGFAATRTVIVKLSYFPPGDNSALDAETQAFMAAASAWQP